MTLYLDTSSLVKLYVAEIGSDEVRDLVDRATIVATSVVAYPEARAALARLRRTGDLTSSQLARARRAFETQWPAYLAVDVTNALATAAGDYAERYGLRGFDAVHLASFAEIARRADGETRFSSFDEPLNKAAAHLAKRGKANAPD